MVICIILGGQLIKAVVFDCAGMAEIDYSIVQVSTWLCTCTYLACMQYLDKCMYVFGSGVIAAFDITVFNTLLLLVSLQGLKDGCKDIGCKGISVYLIRLQVHLQGSLW